MAYKKPQDPLTNNGFGIYPLTTADQVILSDGSRLEKNGQISIGGGTVKTVSGVTPDSAGNVALTASDVGALPSGGTALDSSKLGGKSASEYALKTDTAPDSSKLGGKAPEYYLQPRNLLDNSDFRNPVNQRGQNSYSLGNWGGYTIDRWAAYVNGVDLALTENGISFSKGIYQRISKDTVAMYNGKNLTFSAKIGDIVYICSGVITQTGSWHIAAECINGSSAIRMEVENTNDMMFIIENSSAATVEWTALYEGSYTADTMPPYVPKGYAAEFAECMRYYYTIRSDGASYAAYATGTMNDASHAYFPIVFPVTMRIAPTLSYSGNLRVYVNGSGRPITGIENNMPSRYSARITVENISSGVLGQSCELQSNNDGTAFIAFSADL